MYIENSNALKQAKKDSHEQYPCSYESFLENSVILGGVVGAPSTNIMPHSALPSLVSYKLYKYGVCMDSNNSTQIYLLINAVFI